MLEIISLGDLDVLVSEATTSGGSTMLVSKIAPLNSLTI